MCRAPLEALGAHERRRAPQAQDVEHLARDVDPLVGRHLLGDETHREQRREVVGPDGLAGRRVQRRLQRLGQHRQHVEPRGRELLLRQDESSHQLPPRSDRMPAHRLPRARSDCRCERAPRPRARRRSRPRPCVAASSGARIALSATATTSPGIRPASRSLRPRSSANVPRSRAFTPTTVAPAASARSSSASSCASTSATRPSSSASSWRSREKPVVVERGDDEEHGVGADRPGLVDLGLVDREVLAQDRAARPSARAACRSSTDPPKNARSVSTDSAAAPPVSYAFATTPGSRSGRELALRRRPPLDLGDHREAPVGAAQRAGEVARRRRVERGAAQRVASLGLLEQRDLGALGGEDLVQHAHALPSVRPPSIRHPWRSRFPTASSGARPPPRTRSRRQLEQRLVGVGAHAGHAVRRAVRRRVRPLLALPEDIALLADLGFGAYRFSLEWSRIEPEDGEFSNERARPLPADDRRLPRERGAPRRDVPPLHDAALGGVGRRLGRIPRPPSGSRASASAPAATSVTASGSHCTINEPNVVAVDGLSTSASSRPARATKPRWATATDNLIRAHRLRVRRDQGRARRLPRRHDAVDARVRRPSRAATRTIGADA